MAASKRRAKRTTIRRNAKRGSLLVRTLALVTVGAMAVLGGYAVTESSVFGVKEVVTVGNKYVTPKKMMELMGLRMGESLLKLPSAEVVEMLEVSEWVKRASIRKEYPGTLVVKIEEAVPAALLEVRQDVYFVDTEGRVLEKLESAPVSFLPVIVSGSARNPKAFSEAVVLAGVLKRKGLARQSGRIEISGVEKAPEDLTMHLDGLTVRVGSGKYEEKLRRYAELNGEIKRRHVSVKYIDLRFDDSVVVKPFKENAG